MLIDPHILSLNCRWNIPVKSTRLNQLMSMIAYSLLLSITLLALPSERWMVLDSTSLILAVMPK